MIDEDISVASLLQPELFMRLAEDARPSKAATATRATTARKRARLR
jgi:hypothetical protein